MRISSLLVIALCACGGSTGQVEAPPPSDSVPATDAESKQSVERIESWLEAWNRKDVDDYMAHLVPGTIGNYIGQATPQPSKPIEEEREAFTTIWKLFPNAREDALVLMANGNRSATLWRIDTGAGQTFAGASLSGHAPDRRINEFYNVTDGLTQLHQWGVRPSDDAPDAEPIWDPVVRAIGTGSETERANVELLRAFSAGWSTNDTAAIGALLAPSYSHRALPLKTTLDGPTLLKELSERAGKTVSSVDVKETWGAGDWVVQRAELTMSFSAGDNAGKSAKLGGIFFAEIVDGKIARTIGAFNNAQVLVNLGEMTPAEFDALEAKLLKKIGLDDAQ